MKTGVLWLGSIIVLMLNSGCGEFRSTTDEAEESEIGVALYSFNRFPFPQTLEMSKEAGARIVEGFFFHKLGNEFGEKRISDLTEQEVVKLKTILSESDVEMRSMYVGGKTEEEWENQFRKAKELGLSFVVGEPGRNLWDAVNKMAGDYNIPLAIHEHARGKSIFWHPDSVLAAIEGHDNFGACGDLGHWVRSGLDPVECLKMLEGHLISIHAKDLDEFGVLDVNDVKVGTGVIDYDAVMAELERQNFTGPIYIECEHDWENNLQDVKYAVELLRKYQKTHVNYYNDQD